MLRLQLLNRARGLDFYGKSLAFFFLCVAMTIYAGIKNIVQASSSRAQVQADDGQLLYNLDLFAYILPFISFIVDVGIKRVYFISAKLPYVLIKMAIILFYLAFYVFSLQK